LWLWRRAVLPQFEPRSAHAHTLRLASYRAKTRVEVVNRARSRRNTANTTTANGDAPKECQSKKQNRECIYYGHIVFFIAASCLSDIQKRDERVMYVCRAHAHHRRERPTMTKSDYGGSAKIYQFPVRARAVTGGHRDELKPSVDVASSRVAKAAVGSGWYHEAAIQEAERARQN
jgi:hypothetical protein